MQRPFGALKHASASLGAGLQQLNAEGRLLTGRACQSVLQSLRRSLAAAPTPPPLRQHVAPRRLVHACSSSSGSAAGQVAEELTKNHHQQEQEPQQQTAASTDNNAGTTEPPAPAPLCSTTTALGQVMAAQANFVRVKVDALEGGQPGEAPPRARLLCVVRALLKKIKQDVVVGDRVRVVGIDWADGRGMVEEVLPRSSQLAEPAVANVDHVLLVFSAALPAFQPSPATRYLLSAEAAWLPVTVAINKADLVPPERIEEVVQQVTSWGYQAVPVSVVSGEGLDALTEALRGRVTVVAGPSGAGKSSIINALRLRSLGLEGTLEAMQAEPSGAAAAAGDEDGAEGSCRSEGSDAEEEAEENAGATEQQQQRRGRQQSSDDRSSAQGQEQQQQQGQQAAADVAAAAQQRGQERGSGPAEQQQQQGAATESLNGSGGNGSGNTASALPADLELQAVGQVSERIGRGKHTTRNVTLLELEGSSGTGSGGGGLVVDTPGFNQPELRVPAAELWQHFPEIRQRLEEGEERCAFRGCQHLQEPGCVVRGEWERYPLYCEIHAELKALEELEAARQASKKRREGSVRVKSRAGGQQGVEARLETKTHRRVSRRSVRQKLSDLVKDVEDGDEW